MFGNLLKYDIKAAGKFYLLLNVSVLIASIILGLSLHFSPKTLFEQDNTITSLSIFLLETVFFVLIVGSMITTLILIIRRFYLGIFGREGYFTMTLPISIHQILLAKLTSAFLWTVFNFVSLCLGGIILYNIVAGMGNFLVSFPIVVNYFTSSTEIISLIIGFIISTLSNILLLYLAIAIGHLSYSRPILMSFVAYIGINVILSFLLSVMNNSILASLIEKNNLTYILITIIESIVTGFLYYGFTYYIIRKKLNLT